MTNTTKSDKYIQRILLFTIVILINIVSIYVYQKYDLTKNKSYTLSKETIDLIRQPTEQVHIKLFFSSNLPAELLTIKNYTKDLLNEYQSYSKGKISFEFVNTNNEKNFKQQASDSQIPSVTIQVMEKDKTEYREIFTGMFLTYKGGYDRVPIITSTNGLEYLISTAIKNLVIPEEKKIAYFSPIEEKIENNVLDEENGRLPIDPKLEVMVKMLSKNYLVDRTDLHFPLPDETDLLIISGITDSLNIVQLYLLDQFIMRGKPILWFQDRYIADSNAEYAEIIDSNAIRYLFEQSLYIKPNLILDAFCDQLSKYRQQGEYLVPVSFDYPFYPVLINFNKTHPITRNLDNMLSLFPSEIFYTNNKELLFTPLIMSSSNSSEKMGKDIEMSYLQFQDISLPAVFNQPPKAIAGLYEGKLQSYFYDKEMRHDKYINNTDHAKILLVASNSLCDNNILANVPGNAEFLLNAVDYLIGNESLIGMRAKTLAYSPFIKTTERMRFWVKILNFVLPVLMILAFFIVHILRRLIQKAKIKRDYNE